MPTTRNGPKSATSAAVPDKPKTFSPELRDPRVKNAWDHLEGLANGQRTVATPSENEKMLALARSNLWARRIREQHLPDPMFGEPAWDMILSLYVGAVAEARSTVSSLSRASRAPPTTALRWMDYLEREQFVTRRSSPTDKRVVFVELTERGRVTIEAYLRDLISRGFTDPTHS